MSKLFMPCGKVWLLLCRFHHVSLHCSRHLLYRLVSQSEEKVKNKDKYNLRTLAQRNWVKIFSTEFYLNRPNNFYVLLTVHPGTTLGK